MVGGLGHRQRSKRKSSSTSYDLNLKALRGGVLVILRTGGGACHCHH